MDPEELYAKVRHQPFEPFRIHVSDGTIYEVRHPDEIMVGRRSSHVGMRGRPDGPFPKIAIVANIHIARIEPLNGQRRKRAGGRGV